MSDKKSSIKKMCSFYVSDWHLATMMLPYISKLIKENTQIEAILEPGMEDNIKELTSKLNMNPDIKQKIWNINWNKTEDTIVEIKQKDKRRKQMILVNGTKEKMERINNLLEKELDKEQKEKTTIINCYDATKIKEDIQEILEQHEHIINTSGMHEIHEIFPFFKQTLDSIH